MTKQEIKEVKLYLNGIYTRINKAKSALHDLNIGTAIEILSQPFPGLKMKETEE